MRQRAAVLLHNFAPTALGMCFACLACAHSGVKLGADVLVERRLDVLRDKRVGLVTNHTGRLSTGEHLVDVLQSRMINVVALFGPEHGIRGLAADGESVRDSIDTKTGVPVFSLYGGNKKPTAEMLRGIDVLVYHIQDVGARFYTYISTMGLAMEAAAENHIPFVVLDRPNPLGGLMVDGPVLEDSLKSFVGMFPIPVVYGLTCGELATMINDCGWLAGGLRTGLTVIPMEGWRRSMVWEETGLAWYPPSPNIPTPAAAILYPATCMIEATNLSEGRGTPRPFQTVGAPFINSEKSVQTLQRLNLPGISLRQVSFVPASSKFKSQECFGISIELADYRTFRPTFTGLAIMQTLLNLHPDRVTVAKVSFDRRVGSVKVLDEIKQGTPPLEMEKEWVPRLEQYRTLARQYRIYVDN